MAYSSGGLIENTDYNNFINGSNQLNTVWGVGTGNTGYGQTPIASVSSAGMVTAAQWATLINTLNSITVHQSGTPSGIFPVLPGSQINYLSTLGTAINTVYTNRLNFSLQSSTTTGSTFSPNFSVGNQSGASTWTFTRTISFSSGDAARYFFNAGGQLNFVSISASANDGTARSSDWTNLLQNNFNGITAIRQASNGGRTGSGGTLNTNATSLGYYNSTTTDQILVSITSTGGGYTGDYMTVGYRTNGTQGSNSDKGSIIYLDFTVYSAARTDGTPGGPGGAAGGYFNDSLNVTWNHRVDVVYPETTNLATASWGTVTIS